jgi:hypothetical protein
MQMMLIKYSMAHACFEMNQLLLQLKECASNQSKESEKSTLLDDLEETRKRRDELFNQLCDEGIEVEMEIEGLRVTNLVFNTVLKDEILLPADEIGHSFDITIPIIENEQAMKEQLRKKLAPLRAESRSISDVDEAIDSDS